MATLGEILELLPDVGRERLAYQSRYWILKANELLSMVETSVRGSAMYEESYLPLNGKQTLYRMPANLRKVQRIRRPSDIGMKDLRTDFSKIDFEMMGGNIRLMDPPNLTATSFSLTQSIQSFTSIRHPLPIDDRISEGWGCIIKHTATGKAEYRRVLGINDAQPTQVDLDGETESQIIPLDTASVFDFFLIVEGQKKLERFKDTDSVSPLPEEWNQILVYGLRWAMESQSEEDGSSQNSLMWLNRFENALQGFEGDASERPGDQGRINPRPSCFWDGFGR